MASVTEAADLGVRSPARGFFKPSLGSVLCTLVLLIVGFAVLYPLWLIIVQSFDVSKPGQAMRLGLDGWAAVFTERGLRTAVGNTLTLSLTRQALALPLAIGIAWL